MAPDVWSLAALTYVLLVNRDLYGLHATPPDQARFVHGRPLFLEEVPAGVLIGFSTFFFRCCNVSS